MPPQDFDPYHQWLGIRSSRTPINNYRLLGLDVFESDVEVIANAADRQMAHIRGFQNGRHADLSQRLLAEIAAARICLLDLNRKEEYDEELSRQLLESGDGPSSDGAAFGEYLLRDQLAVASASTIYEVEHRTMRRVVALQTLNSTAAASPREVSRFRRKAAILAKLDHPHLITAFDAGVRDGFHCLVMELVSGDSLLAHLRKRNADPPAPAPPIPQMLEWMKQTAAGLGHAHSRGIIHRRVAPSNLLIDEHRGIKVAGFGLALQAGAGADEAPESAGAMIGNIDYVAPEQLASSRDIDLRADIYGLGCTLSALLRGRPPFLGSVADKIQQHQHAAPPSLRAVDGVDDALEAIVQRMMAKRPEDRFATMYDVIQALQTWLLGSAAKPQPTVVAEPRDVPRAEPRDEPDPAVFKIRVHPNR